MAKPLYYILHGEDEFNRKAQITAMRESLNDPNELNLSIFDGTEVSAQAVLNAVSIVPFLSDKRLVIVEGMLQHLAKRNKAELQILVDQLPGLPPFARLVFHENTTLKASHPVMKLVGEDPNGYQKAFNAPKNTTAWITKRAEQEYGVTIEAQAAAALASVVDKDLRAADNELAKLTAYVDDAKHIREADVALLTSYIAEANIFDMVDAIGQRDGQTAIRLVEQLLADKSEPLALFGMINRQFRLLILAKEHLDGGSAGSLAEAIGTRSDFVARKMGKQARNFNKIETLESIYRVLAEYDYNIKTGKMTDRMALEMFIAAVTD